MQALTESSLSLQSGKNLLDGPLPMHSSKFQPQNPLKMSKRGVMQLYVYPFERDKVQKNMWSTHTWQSCKLVYIGVADGSSYLPTSMMHTSGPPSPVKQLGNEDLNQVYLVQGK